MKERNECYRIGCDRVFIWESGYFSNCYSKGWLYIADESCEVDYKYNDLFLCPEHYEQYKLAYVKKESEYLDEMG